MEKAPFYFEDNTTAADFVKDNLERITGFKTYQVDPKDEDCMLPAQFDKIEAWYKENYNDIDPEDLRGNVEDDFEDFWDNFIDWTECYHWVNGSRVYDPR